MAKKPPKKTKKYLTPAEKAEGLRLWNTGRFTRQELADKLNVSHSTMCKLISAAPVAPPSVSPAQSLVEIGAELARLGDRLREHGYRLHFHVMPLEG